MSVVKRRNIKLIILDEFHKHSKWKTWIKGEFDTGNESHMLQHLLNRVPALPVVVHTYASEYGDAFKNMEELFFVEKRGSSVERLKQVVYEILVEPSSRGQKI